MSVDHTNDFESNDDRRLDEAELLANLKTPGVQQDCGRGY